MTHQLDLIGLPLDAALTRHITGKISFPVPREVRKPRLHDVLTEASRFDVSHEFVLPKRARKDHR